MMLRLAGVLVLFLLVAAMSHLAAIERLHLTPGGHAITLYLEGYRTVTQDVYVRPDSTFKLNETMERLSAGQASEPPPLPVTRPGRFAVRPRQG